MRLPHALLVSGAGALLLALLLVDVYLTVFDAHGRGGPLHFRQNRLVWAGLRRIARALPRDRGRALLSAGGPALAALTVLVWVALLVLSFTLLFEPHVDGFSYGQDVPQSGWLTALYYSGYTASTLGLGDVAPATPALRLATAAESILGFGLFSLSITYVLALYRGLQRAETLALYLRELLHRDGRDLVPAERQAEIARELLCVLQVHLQYPVLHHFQSRDDGRLLLLQLGNLLVWLRSPGGGDGLLLRSVERYLGEVNDRFVPRNFSPARSKEPEDLQRRLRRYGGLD